MQNFPVKEKIGKNSNTVQIVGGQKKNSPGIRFVQSLGIDAPPFTLPHTKLINLNYIFSYLLLCIVHFENDDLVAGALLASTDVVDTVQCPNQSG